MGKILIMKSLLEKKGSEKVSDRHACSEEVAKRAELRTSFSLALIDTVQYPTTLLQP